MFIKARNKRTCNEIHFVWELVYQGAGQTFENQQTLNNTIKCKLNEIYFYLK